MKFINKYSNVFTFIGIPLTILTLFIAKIGDLQWYLCVVTLVFFSFSIFCAYLYGRSKGEKNIEQLKDANIEEVNRIRAEHTKEINKIKTELETANNKQIIDCVCAYFESLKGEDKKEKDYEIIRWGLAVSRALWANQQYSDRIKIGEYLEEAANNLKEEVDKVLKNDTLIKIYIDILGWTNAELEDYLSAEEFINKGIKLAKQENNWYMLSKGYRHLLSLNNRQGLTKKSEEHIKNAKEAADNAQKDNKVYIELLAEYYYAKAIYEYKTNVNFVQALNDIGEAKNLFDKTNNENWKIKVEIKEGEICFEKNDLQHAEELFNNAKNKANSEKLNKPFVRCLIGLGKCYIKKGEKRQAEKNYKKAETFLIDAQRIVGTDMRYEKRIIENLLHELKTKK